MYTPSRALRSIYADWNWMGGTVLRYRAEDNATREMRSDTVAAGHRQHKLGRNIIFRKRLKSHFDCCERNQSRLFKSMWANWIELALPSNVYNFGIRITFTTDFSAIRFPRYFYRIRQLTWCRMPVLLLSYLIALVFSPSFQSENWHISIQRNFIWLIGHLSKICAIREFKWVARVEGGNHFKSKWLQASLHDFLTGEMDRAAALGPYRDGKRQR